jgi:hypothetical protein
MNIYLINALLVLLVIHQIREHQLDLRALAVPVLAVGAAAVMFLHTVPGGGSDIALELLGVSAGAAMGAIGGLATRLRLGADGRPLGRAGVLAAGMWIAGVGARMGFYFAATHGAGPAIAAFSVSYHITGSTAWTAALVMMALADVLTRLMVVFLRGHRLTAKTAPAIAPSAHAGAGARASVPARATHTVLRKAPPTAAPYPCHPRPTALPKLGPAADLAIAAVILAVSCEQDRHRHERPVTSPSTRPAPAASSWTTSPAAPPSPPQGLGYPVRRALQPGDHVHHRPRPRANPASSPRIPPDSGAPTGGSPLF